MTELDFDELDKAVSDLMQDAVKPGTAATSVTVITDQPPAPDADATTAPSQTPAPAAPLAMKRGRFMDVMAPAGQKKNLVESLTVHKPAAVAAVASEDSQAPVDVPDDEHEQKDMNVSVNADPAPEQAQQPVDAPVVAEQENVPVHTEAGEYAANPAPAHEWPEPEEVSDLGNDHLDDEAEEAIENDPVDSEPETEASDPAADTKPAEQDKPTAEPEEQTIPVNTSPSKPEESDLTTIVTPDAPAPTVAAANPLPGSVMSSPFLPDAKVEKRPLGGDAVADPAVASSHPQDALPREYDADLMNLEADTNADARATAQQSAPTAAPVAPAAQDAAGKPATGTIFDTDTYHAPLKQPVKHKSGWLTLIWIFALLIVGAIGGAAYYFYSIQQ